MKSFFSPVNIRELQLAELEILKDIKRICEEHSLRYYMTAGTLLGAVRHQGFIPWDDDIDIAMPRNDYERFTEIASAVLPQKYFFQNSKTDTNFTFFFSKIRKNDTEVFEEWLEHVDMHKGLFVDIFPLDVCPRSDKAAELFFKGMLLITSAMNGKTNPGFVCGYTKKYMRVLYVLLEQLPLGWLVWLREFVRKIVEVLCGKDRLCTVGGAHGFPYEVFKSSWFGQTVFLPFEGELFAAPSGWNDLLKNMYGEYMIPPTIENRKGHFE